MRIHKQTATLIAAVPLLMGTAALIAATSLPVLWTAGGLDAGTTGGGQSARMAVDAMGNVAVVSGPALNSTDLAVVSYTQGGTFRWRRTVTPSVGSFTGDWIAASPEGDMVAVGRNRTSTGSPIGTTLVRYSSGGTLLWRRDIAGTAPSVGRLLVDAASSSYLAFNSVGDGQDIRLQKYDPSGILLWSQAISTGSFANDIATSAALSPNGAEVIVTGNIVGGATWIVASFNAVTGARRWLVVSPEGLTTRDVVVDASRVFVTGQSFTGAGTPALRYWLTVVAYDRLTGARLWRRDLKPGDAADAAGLRMTLAPDGGVIATGQANRGFLDWYTVALEPTGALRWEAVRDGGLNTDEIPAAVFTLADGTTVVTGKGGPNLPGGFIPGVTVGYGRDGTLLWQAFARMATVWGSALPNGDVCATGGYDALITCWRPAATSNQAPTAVMSAAPATGPGPLTVTFDGSASSDADGAIVAWSWAFGDGQFGVGARTAHMYSGPATYTASLTVTDDGGATSTTTRTIVVTGELPQPPAALGAAAVGRRSISLTWTNGPIVQTAVLIERCTGSGCTNFAQVASAAGNSTMWTDRSLAARTTYSYRVRASNASGTSPYSNTASARTGR
jgi:chitodextrinase